jgi:hypothetical protein
MQFQRGNQLPRPFRSFSQGQHTHMCCIVLVPPRDFMEIARYRLVLIANCTSIVPLQFPFNFKYLCFRLVVERKIKNFRLHSRRQKKRKIFRLFTGENELSRLPDSRRRGPGMTGACWSSPFVQLLTLFNAISTKGHANCRGKKECLSCPSS